MLRFDWKFCPRNLLAVCAANFPRPEAVSEKSLLESVPWPWELPAVVWYLGILWPILEFHMFHVVF